MCDFLKEIFQAAQQRIRSPFIGSVIFAFIAVNWQALYFLFFADVSVLARITYFNVKTSYGSLYGWPLLIGGIMALVLPFIRVGFVWCVRFANRWLHQLQAGEAILREINELELAVKKTKAEADLAVARAEGQARVQEVEELSRIEAAKRDVEAKVEIKDQQVAERLQEEIQEVRDRPAGIVTQQGRIGPGTDASISPTANSREDQLAESLDALSTLIVFALGRVSHANVNIEALPNSNVFKSILRNNGYLAEGVRLMQEYLHSMEELERKEVLELELVDTRQMHGKRHYTAAKLTVLGYKVFDKISPKLIPPDQVSDADNSE
ncbi:hypothetical protein [Halocynthiibacter styelae]|uniref:Uncharacterized protein n=1 Tax=Halocynthiibacter styelae TaxID=2761955 RepID=A0A8J7IP95_9RHOB|nr:hypothetical protein [Paenihalocynthiibacter styelae]MBI1492681.1 hypothetical protein [Paenihalocynthiibacter styelae]